MKCFSLCIFLAFSCCAVAKQNEYQTQFPTVHQYLHRFGKNPAESDDAIVVKTLPFSGTNITIAMLNYLTQKNCLWDRGDDWKRGVIVNRALVNTDPSAFPIIGSHEQNAFNNLKDHFLITTIRNYKEWFSKIHSDISKIPSQSLRDYMNHLRFFDEWNTDKKLLIRFEDLLENPKKVVGTLTYLLQLPQSRKEELLATYQSFSDKVLYSYKAQMGTKNLSLKTHFHRKKFSQEALKLLENKLKRIDPYLFNKYLEVYSVN